MDRMRHNELGGHVTKRVKLNGRFVQVDHNIVELVKLLNQLEFTTFASCGGGCFGRCRNGHKGIPPCRESIAIGFSCRQSDIEKFMSLVIRKSDSEDYKECVQGVSEQNAWHWPIYIDDLNDHSYIDAKTLKYHDLRSGSTKFGYVFCVIIPHAHHDIVVKRLTDALKKKLKRDKK